MLTAWVSARQAPKMRTGGSEKAVRRNGARAEGKIRT
jgi:hypothetical protein